jgi:hypothetical protein
VLPWLALRHGADDAASIQRRRDAALAQPVGRRAEYAGLALFFAEAAGRKELWKKGLEGFDLRESQVVKEWQAEGAVRGAAGRLPRFLELKFTSVPPALRQRIEGTQDLAQLAAWLALAYKEASLDQFTQPLSTPVNSA